MLSLSFLIVLVGVLAPSFAVQPCCFPLQWEGGQTLYVPSTEVYMRSKVASDLQNKRIASCATIMRGKKVFHMKAIVDWQAKQRYYIYKINNKEICRAHPIKSPLPDKPNCLPDSFRYMASYTIGAGSASLQLNGFGFFTKDYQNVLRVTSDCIPVRDTVIFQTPMKKFWNKKTYMSSSWYNITAGIRDSSVFNVPDACKKSQEEAVRTHIDEMQLPFNMKDDGVMDIFGNIEEFEAAQEAPVVSELHQQPHGAFHMIHASMNNIVDEALEQAAKMVMPADETIDRLFNL